MEIDEDKIDDAVLALLYLTADKNGHAWKNFDWAVTKRLHAKEMISDPVGKAKGVYLTTEGLEKAKHLFEKLFAKAP